MENLEILKVKPDQVKLVSDEYINIGNMPVKVSTQAKRDICQLSQLGTKAIRKMNRTINGDGGFKVMNEIIKRTNDSLNLIINKEDMSVVRISNKTPNISYDAFEQLTNHIVESNDDILKSSTHNLNFGTTNIISLNNSNPHDVGLVGENITTGKTIKWDLVDGISIQDNIIRQICQNGMIGSAVTAEKGINSMSIDDLYNELLRQINSTDDKDIKRYQEMVSKAMTTNLSIYEHNQIWSFLQKNWNKDDERIQRYIGNDNWKGQYIDRGIKILDMTNDQLRNCPTPVNTYDAINCLTDLASHDYKSEVSDQIKYQAQVMAHTKLYGSYDALAYVPNAPKFKNEGPRMSSYQPTQLN